MRMSVMVAVLGLLGSPMLVRAEGPEPIPADAAQRFGERLAEEAGKLANAPLAIEADASQANGVHVPQKMGLLVIPQKGLKEGQELAEKFRTDKGAAIGYLLAYNAVPINNGQRVDQSRLRKITVTDGNGNDRSVNVFWLAVRQLSDSDYRLFVYGQGQEPLLDAKFSQVSENASNSETVKLAIKDTNEQTREGKVVITVFGKYAAEFAGGHQEN